jgi:hypothetical protein
MNHLISRHKHKLLNPEDSKQPRIKEMLPTIPLFTENIFNWIVLSDQPFTEVESEPFKKLLYVLMPNLTMMSADTMRQRILDIFDRNFKVWQLQTNIVHIQV